MERVSVEWYSDAVQCCLFFSSEDVLRKPPQPSHSVPPQRRKIIKWQFGYQLITHGIHSNIGSSSVSQTWGFTAFLSLLWFILTLKVIYQKPNRLGIQSENNTCTRTAGSVQNNSECVSDSDEYAENNTGLFGVPWPACLARQVSVSPCAWPAGRSCHRC